MRKFTQHPSIEETKNGYEKIRITKEGPAMYIVYCPHCFRELASSSERDMLPDIYFCNCDEPPQPEYYYSVTENSYRQDFRNLRCLEQWFDQQGFDKSRVKTVVENLFWCDKEKGFRTIEIERKPKFRFGEIYDKLSKSKQLYMVNAINQYAYSMRGYYPLQCSDPHGAVKRFADNMCLFFTENGDLLK